MSKLHISAGNTPTSETDLYISQAKQHFGCITTPSSTVAKRSRPECTVTSGNSLPDPVCIVDKRYVAFQSALCFAPMSNFSRAYSLDDDKRQTTVCDGISDNTVKNLRIPSPLNVDTRDDESLVNSEEDYDSERDVKLFSQHKRRNRCIVGGVLSRLSGVQALKKFLSGTPGEKYWCLWLDIERAKLAHNTSELHRYN